jgi:hypothetical protein
MKIVRASFKPRLFAAAFAIAALLVVTLVEAVPASGQSGGASTSTLTNGGVLQLHLGASDSFGFRDADSSQPTGYSTSLSQTQAIGNGSGCRLSPTSGSLVSLSSAPSGSSVGFVSDAIGVRTNSEGNGQPCGRIDAPGQALTMDLNLAGKVIDYAELDIELKFGGTVMVNGYLDGTQVGAPATYSSVGSDSGPDSGDGDNYRVRFPRSGFTAVDRLVFSIVGSTGGASLEGGADGTQPCDPADAGECGPVGSSLGQTLTTNDSLFHLINADGILDCGDSASQTNAGITTTVARLDNVSGNCTPIPYNQDSSGTCTGGFLQCIFLQKDLDGQQVQFFWTVTWAPEDPAYLVHPTQFDFGDGRGFVDLQICGPSTGLVSPPIPGFPSFFPTPSSDPWCVVDTQTNLQPDGQVVVTETYFGQNDPSGHR